MYYSVVQTFYILVVNEHKCYLFENMCISRVLIVHNNVQNRIANSRQLSLHIISVLKRGWQKSRRINVAKFLSKINLLLFIPYLIFVLTLEETSIKSHLCVMSISYYFRSMTYLFSMLLKIET